MMIGLALSTAGPAAARPSTLSWTGTAKIFDKDRVIEIAVETRVEPFKASRSRSWIVSEGPARARTMTLEGDTGTMMFADQHRAMTPTQVRHERMQFGLYGLMLNARGKGRCVTARHRTAPDTRLCFDQAGLLASGSNTVPDADTGAPVAQTFEFSGSIRSNGVTWPRQLRILHGGKPYFELTIATFEAR